VSEAIQVREDPLELDTMKLGRVLAESGFFSDSREAAQAVVKVLAGRELGFGPIASMRGVNIIKGKVSLAADLQAAAIKGSAKYDYRVREHDSERCVIEFFQGSDSVGVSTFTMADAKDAGLLANDTWRKYPRNMLFARAMSNGARWYCPDVFGGAVYAPEELGARVDEEGSVVEVSAPALEVEWEEKPKGPRKSTAKQKAKLAVLASNFGWDDEERRRRAGVASFTDLTFDQASLLIEAWESEETPGGVATGETSLGKEEDPGEGTPPGPTSEGAGERKSPSPDTESSAPEDDAFEEWDEPATEEHLARGVQVFGGSSKLLLAARHEFPDAGIQSSVHITKRQLTQLIEGKLG
jgi:hypothetical protein